jgi:hypothetical protein
MAARLLVNPELKGGPWPPASSKLQQGMNTMFTHQTAPTEFVDANGIRFAYRVLAIKAAFRSSSICTSPVRWIIGIHW